MCLRTLVGFCLSSVFLGASNPIPPAPQTVKFLNQVEVQKLQEPTLSEIAEIEAALKLDNVDPVSLNRRQNVFVAFFSRDTSSQTPGHIKIPETGSFQLRLRKNANFEIVDQDATDGQAEIHMPASTLQTWLHSSQAWDEKSSLVIEDPLYYVKDTVSYSDKPWLSQKLWLKMGLRPLPIPLSWGSSEGEDYVLNFRVKAMPSFQMGWVSHKDKPVEPPFGIREIGPEGGIVALPGVGKLEIPAGALDTQQMIRLKQVMNAPAALSEFPFPGGDKIEKDYVSSVLEVQPKGLKFNKDFYPKITLNANLERLGNNTPAVLSYVFSDDISYVGGGWRRLPRLMPIPSTSEGLLSHPSLLMETGFFARVMDKEIPPDAGVYTISNLVVR